jgi:6-phosphogluconolactonase
MIRVFNDLDQLSEAAAEMFMDLANQVIHTRGRFIVVLSGGNTPRCLYQLLAAQPYRDKIHWKFIHFFWGDERCVPANDPRNNALMAYQSLIDHIPIPAANIHAVQCDLPPALAAKLYESELKKFFGNQPPIFDLILLGMGENAHTASLFPQTSVLNETERWVAEVYLPEQGMYRVTFTVPLINQANQVVFLVSGADKALALQKVLEGVYQPQEYPAQLIHPNGTHPDWLVDKAASHKLTTEMDDTI